MLVYNPNAIKPLLSHLMNNPHLILCMLVLHSVIQKRSGVVKLGFGKGVEGVMLHRHPPKPKHG